MKKTIQSVHVNHGGKTILVEHNQQGAIRIFDEPRGLSYEHAVKRGIQNEKHMLQDIQMMDFQAKVSSLLRMSLKDEGETYPLTGEYRVEVEITSSRNLSELPLLSTLKSVMDGINKQIILDDSSMLSCSIKYSGRAMTPRSGVTKSPDELTVRLFDCQSSSNVPVAEFEDVPVYVVPKAESIKLDWNNDARFTFEEDDYQEAVASALQNEGIQISGGGPHKINLLFRGNVSTKDIDNMARMYYPILEHLGLHSQDVVEVILAKQQVTPIEQSCIQIIVSSV